MKKISLYVFLVLFALLTSCSDKEEKKEAAKRKAETTETMSKYMDGDLIMKLAELQKNERDKTLETPSSNIVIISLMYMGFGTKMISCEIMKGILEEPNTSDETSKILSDLDLRKECEVYTEIFEKYNSMYITAVETQTIPTFYFFRSKEIGSEGFDFDTIGMFPTLDECKHYLNIFMEKELSLVGKCKKYGN